MVLPFLHKNPECNDTNTIWSTKSSHLKKVILFVIIGNNKCSQECLQTLIYSNKISKRLGRFTFSLFILVAIGLNFFKPADKNINLQNWTETDQGR